MEERKPVYIISDGPARKDKVVFGFEAYARCADRYGNGPLTRGNGLGFRCARTKK